MVAKALKKHQNCTLFNPFSPDGTLKCRFEKFLNFHLEGKGCQDTYERRDYEALAGYLGNYCRTNAKVYEKKLR